jgi:hypothetical protein
MTPARSKSNAAAIRAAEETRRALKMRKQGASFEEIGRSTGVSPITVRARIIAACKRLVSEPAEALRALELRRLDEAQLDISTAVDQIMQKLSASDGQKDGQESATYFRRVDTLQRLHMTLLAIQERRARYCGLDYEHMVARNLLDLDKASPNDVVDGEVVEPDADTDADTDADAPDAAPTLDGG